MTRREEILIEICELLKIWFYITKNKTELERYEDNPLNFTWYSLIALEDRIDFLVCAWSNTPKENP